MNKTLEYKINIFKALYTTMYRAQNNLPLFKTNFLEKKKANTAKEWEREIIKHCEQKPASRTAKAWELTEKHMNDCNISNIALVNELYHFVCEHQTYLGSRFFSSFIKPQNLTQEKIDNADYYKDSNLWNVKFWLNVELHKSFPVSKTREIVSFQLM